MINQLSNNIHPIIKNIHPIIKNIPIPTPSMSAIHTVKHLLHCHTLNDDEGKFTTADDEGWHQLSKLFVQMTCTQLKNVAKFKTKKYWSVYNDSTGSLTELFLSAGMPERKIVPIIPDLLDIPMTEEEIYEMSPHAVIGDSLNDILSDNKGLDCKDITSVWLDYRFRFEGHLDQFPVIHIGQLLQWYLTVGSLMFISLSTFQSDVNTDNIEENLQDIFDNREINPHQFAFVREHTFILPSKSFFVVILRIV